MEAQDSRFDCNICLEPSRESVITLCGHLYCWPCIYSWLHSNQEFLCCPVCRNGLTVSSILPIYTRENEQTMTAQQDIGRDPNIPPRPSTQRQSPARNHNLPNGQGGLTIPNGHILAGYGYFPSLFNLLFVIMLSMTLVKRKHYQV